MEDLRERLEAYLGGPVGAVAELAAGWESDVYGFRHDGADLVVRAYVGRDALDKGRREHTGMTLLAAAGYPVPPVLAFVPDALGRPALIMGRVPAGGVAGVPDAAALLARLHEIDPAPFTKAFGIEPEDTSGWWLRREIDRWRTVLAGLGDPSFGAILDWAEERAPDVPPQQPAVVHWDFHADNLLTSAAGEVAVIDWTQIDVSDPRFDLAWTTVLAASYGREEWSAPFVTAYRRHRPAAGLEWFEAAACAKRIASIVISLRAGPEALGMRPGAATEMREQLPAVRRVYDLLLRRTGITVPEVERLLA